uniref:Peptidoglycan recognition protein family domain-containing protein n=1 Tax=Branchiostoma floridae TaxID=7739 RepID=C3YNA1_BRAFL|eukprot:XP_002602195.1 hypothetical protein BRAFLDRAFT_76882 [Branchiostoma floridae]
MDRVKEIQQDHMDDGWDDIGYNFLIDGYGNVYVGRGWDNTGAHTACCNSIAIGINFLGYFEDDLPTSAADNSRGGREEDQERIRHELSLRPRVQEGGNRLSRGSSVWLR